MTARFLRFLVALLSWMSLSSVGVAALAPEESSEFDGQKVSDFGLQARDGRMLDVRDFRGGPVIVWNSSPVALPRVARSLSN
jgi:hypothetical protein